jgi:serine/threonine-protein kinase/endoribonuclease IRE1
VGDTKEILQQITAGLAHFHLLKFVHGNLKPTNILISIPSGTMKPVMKLADFDHSRNKKGLSGLTQSFFSSANDQYRFVYTRGWIAPETIAKDICTASSDIFLLGLLFAFTLNDGKHPFGDDYLDRIKRIEKKEAMIATAKELDKEFPGALKLIECMLSQEPTKRPKVRQILDNPFFTQSSQVQAQQRTSTLIPQPVAATTLGKSNAANN